MSAWAELQTGDRALALRGRTIAYLINDRRFQVFLDSDMEINGNTSAKVHDYQEAIADHILTRACAARLLGR